MNDLMSQQVSSSGNSIEILDLEAATRNHRPEEPDYGAVEMPAVAAAVPRGKSLASFFEEVGILKSETGQMKERLRLLRDLNEQSRSATSSSTVKSLRESMESHIHALSQHAKLVKQKLKELDLANLENRNFPGCETGSATDRTRLNITQNVHKNLADVVAQFHTFRNNMDLEYRDATQRRYFTVTGETPSEVTLDRIVESGQSEVFLRTAISQQGDPHISSLQLDIILLNERHDALKDVHHSLLLLHQMFLDMAVLVDEQGHKLQTVEDAIQETSSFVDGATRELHEAKKLKKSSRKWTIICLVILIIIILIIIIVLIKLLK